MEARLRMSQIEGLNEACYQTLRRDPYEIQSIFKVDHHSGKWGSERKFTANNITHNICSHSMLTYSERTIEIEVSRFD